MKKSKSEQIQWLVDWCNEKISVHGNVYMTSTNLDLNEEFEKFAQANLGYSVWKSRIRDAADTLGLVGQRAYIADASPSAGLPRFSMVYSLKSTSTSNKSNTRAKGTSSFDELEKKLNRLFPSE